MAIDCWLVNLVALIVVVIDPSLVYLLALIVAVLILG